MKNCYITSHVASQTVQHCVLPTVENCDKSEHACGVEGCGVAHARYSHVIAADVVAGDAIGELFGQSPYLQPMQVRFAVYV